MLCTEPLLFAVTIRVPKLYGGTVSLGRCRFVPPGRLLGARAGCTLALPGVVHRFAFQLEPGVLPGEFPVLEWWQEGEGRCWLSAAGTVHARTRMWRLLLLQPLAPVVWDDTGFTQNGVVSPGPPASRAHGLLLGRHPDVRPLFVENAEVRSECDVFYVFRPNDAAAGGDWVSFGNEWVRTLPWEDVFASGCLDWPLPNETLPSFLYCETDCAERRLYSNERECR